MCCGTRRQQRMQSKLRAASGEGNKTQQNKTHGAVPGEDPVTASETRNTKHESQGARRSGRRVSHAESGWPPDRATDTRREHGRRRPPRSGYYSGAVCGEHTAKPESALPSPRGRSLATTKVCYAPAPRRRRKEKGEEGFELCRPPLYNAETTSTRAIPVPLGRRTLSGRDSLSLSAQFTFHSVW